MIKSYVKQLVEQSLNDAFGRSYSLSHWEMEACFKKALTSVLEGRINGEIGDEVTQIIKSVDLKQILTKSIEEHIKEKFKMSLNNKGQI